MSKVRCGSTGLDHPHLAGSYFPEDIPDEWKLTYYSNDFSGLVLAPHAVLDDCEGFADRFEDVDTGFRFFVYLDTIPPETDMRQITLAAAGYFGGFIIGGAIEPADLPEVFLQDCIFSSAKAFGGGVRYYVDAGGSVATTPEVVRISSMSDLKKLRRQLQALQPQLAQADCFFWLDDDKHDMELLKQLKTLLELMAIA